jgi:hypothetical protein
MSNSYCKPFMQDIIMCKQNMSIEETRHNTIIYIPVCVCVCVCVCVRVCMYVWCVS